MSDETSKDPNTDPNAAAPAEAMPQPAKKKRGFWGWLTGSSEEAPAPQAADESEAALTESTAPIAEAEEAPQPVAAEEAVPAPPPAETEAETPAVVAAPATPEAKEAEAQPTVADENETAPSPPRRQEKPANDVADGGIQDEEAQAARPVVERVTEVLAEPLAERPAQLSTVTPVVETAAPQPTETLEEKPANEEPVAEAPAEQASTPLPEPTGEAAPEPEPEAVEAPVEAAAEAPARKGFWARLTSGLSRTASSLTQGITSLVTKRKLDDETLEELEDILIRADLGTDTSMRIVAAVAKGRYDQMIAPEEVKSLIAAEVEKILEPVAAPLVVDTSKKPFVVLMVGVNGSGKTTTIGKLAAQWRDEGKSVVMAAGDTFRAAAIEQLKVWGARTCAKVIAREQGADAAGVAHEAVVAAREEGADILLIDTAGRLQNRTELMAELEKVVRVVKKLEPEAPHAVLLVLDATVGQNALSQVEAFTRIAGVTGLVMTKLDGTARGGILVAIADKYHLPVHLVGVGEGAEDLQPFTARDFARAIVGLD